MNVILKITAFGNSQSFNAVCRDEDGGKVYYYDLDGDRCTLKLTKDYAVQERSGETDLKLTFLKGQTTTASVSSGGMSGSFPLNTYEYSLKEAQGCVCAKIRYDFGEGSEKLEVEIQALSV